MFEYQTSDNPILFVNLSPWDRAVGGRIQTRKNQGCATREPLHAIAVKCCSHKRTGGGLPNDVIGAPMVCFFGP